MKTRTQTLLGIFVIAMLCLARAGVAQQVQAELSQDYAGVGQPVRLNISVTGGRGAQVPQQLNIDGIDARFVGKSEQMQWQMNGGGVSSTATSTYSYMIVPLRPGEFTIPPISDCHRGKNLQDLAAHSARSERSGSSRSAGHSRSAESEGATSRSSCAARANDASLGSSSSTGRVKNCLW